MTLRTIGKRLLGPALGATAGYGISYLSTCTGST